MEKLSPEDISRAREWREKSGIGRFHHTAECHISKEHPHGTDYISAEEYAAAYSAAENERLTKERDALRDENYHLRHAPRGCSFCGELQGHKQTCWTVGTLLALEAAEAKCDRLKGALERIEEFATTEAQSSRDLDAGDAAEWDKVAKMAALRPEGE